MFALLKNDEKREFKSLKEAVKEAEQGITYKLKWKLISKNPIVWILLNRSLPREKQISSYAVCTITFNK